MSLAVYENEPVAHEEGVHELEQPGGRHRVLDGGKTLSEA